MHQARAFHPLSYFFRPFMLTFRSHQRIRLLFNRPCSLELTPSLLLPPMVSHTPLQSPAIAKSQTQSSQSVTKNVKSWSKLEVIKAAQTEKGNWGCLVVYYHSFEPFKKKNKTISILGI